MTRKLTAGLAALAVAGALGGVTGAQAAGPCGDSYRVAPGDTLSAIAGRCGTSVGALVAANPRITDPARIEIGWQLAMPGSAAASASYSRLPDPYAGTTVTTAPQPRAYGTTAAADPYGTGVVQRQPYGSTVVQREPYGSAVAAAPDPYGAAPVATYQVQSGDTVGAIAQTLGMTMAALLAQNTGVDPQRLIPGQTLLVPRRADYDQRDRTWRHDWRDHRDRGTILPGDHASLSLDSDRGRPGSKVELRADRLVPRERVALGVAGRDGRFQRLEMARADRDGRLREKVFVPDWADPHSRLTFALVRENGEMLQSAPFRVTRHDRADRGNRRDHHQLAGWIVRGTECPLLRTENGRSYALVSNDVRFPLGAYVEVAGEPRDVSYCMEGNGTIDVHRLRQVEPPR